MKLCQRWVNRRERKRVDSLIRAATTHQIRVALGEVEALPPLRLNQNYGSYS